MSQGFEIIKARIKDGAALIIDRLMRSKQQEVVLILPKNSIIAADLNSLKILKEEAESIGKILSLSTENDEIKSFAEKINMFIYDSENFKKTKIAEPVNPVKKIKIMTDILPPSFSPMPETQESIPQFEELTVDLPLTEEKLPEELSPVIYEAAGQNSDLEKNLENFYREDFKNNKLKSENLWRRFYLNRAMPTGRQAISFFAISGFLLFGAAMYLILPKANVKISLKEIPLKAQIPIAVSKNVNSSNLTSGIIPGQYFSLNKAGSKIIEGTPAIGGIIEIYNAYSANPQKLVARTRFETKDGKIFRIKNAITIPGAKMLNTKLTPSSIKAEVIGDGVSDEYLIGPSYFTIPGFKETPKYAGFYAKNFEPMIATKNTALSQEELLKNQKELQDQLAQALKTDILSTLQDSDLRLIDGASLTKVEDYNVNENILSMKITWQALFFKEKDLRMLVNYFVSSHYPDLKNFIFEDSITYLQANRVDFKKGELFFTFNVDKSNALVADLKALKKELAGRDEIGMRMAISEKTYINSAAIFLWPFWVKNAPKNLEKINITIDSQ